MKRYAKRPFLMLFFAALVAGAIFALNRPKPAPFSWCPKHEQAILVGSGRDADGTLTALYMCQRDPKAVKK